VSLFAFSVVKVFEEGTSPFVILIAVDLRFSSAFLGGVGSEIVAAGGGICLLPMLRVIVGAGGGGSVCSGRSIACCGRVNR